MVALEAESGTLAGSAAKVADTTASGGSTIRFGSTVTPPPPPPTGQNGLLTGDVNFFPIGVWQQTPEANAGNYKAIGINVFDNLYDSPTSAGLNAIASNNQYAVLTQQNSLTLGSSVVKSWSQPDEPDNAQPNGSGGYGPCIPVSTLVSKYNAFRAADSQKRPVYLGFGRGVSDTTWNGRGTCMGNTQYYIDAAKAADIFAFDIYPANNGDPLQAVAKGVDNLRGWTGGTKPVWAVIETTKYSGPNGTPTPAQTKFEVWSAIIHGATGINYFAHIIDPNFSEAGLLANANMKSAVAAINAQITSLAAVINAGTTTANTVTSSAGASVPVDTLTKTYNGSVYILAAAMRGASTTATYRPAGVTSGTVTVLGEGRTINISGGAFTDTFAGYDVHIYKIN